MYLAVIHYDHRYRTTACVWRIAREDSISDEFVEHSSGNRPMMYYPVDIAVDRKGR